MPTMENPLDKRTFKKIPKCTLYANEVGELVVKMTDGWAYFVIPSKWIVANRRLTDYPEIAAAEANAKMQVAELRLKES